ncbi:MFS transporter [Virgibacillus ainsalahensis]
MQHRPYTLRDINFWKITVSLALASFFVFASMYAVQPLLPVFVEVFGVSVSESSLTLSLSIVGLIIGLLVLGISSDRVGRTVFIHLSLLGSALPFLIMPFIDSFFVIIGLRFLQGIALAGLPAAALAYISEEIERRSMAVATVLYISSNALGGMVGRVFTGYVTDNYSWEMAFIILAISGVFIAGAVFFLLPNSRFFESGNLTLRKDLEGFLFHLKNPSLLLVFGIGIVLQYSFTGMWTYLPFHLQGEPFSLSLEAISYTFFAYGLGVIGSPVAGWLAGKFGLKPVRVAGLLVLTLGIFLTLSPSLTFIVIGLCVACLGFFTAHSLTATSVSEQVTHHKGSAASLYLVAYYIGVSLGSSALAPVWGLTGWEGLVIFVAILPVAYLVFTQVMSSLIRKRKRE